MDLRLVFVFLVSVALGTCRNNNFHRSLQAKPVATENYYSYTQQQDELTIKIMVHVDRALTKKLYVQYGFQHKNITKMVNGYLSDVEKLYKSVFGKQNIKFKLINTKFLKNKTNIISIGENASDYLKSYCDWQSARKKYGWFYSILLTGLDLYYFNDKGKKVIKSTGRSYIGGMCNVGKSCAIIEWSPDTTTYLIAHEMAHSLGISHDGDSHNKCKAKGHMMGSKYKSSAPPRTFSSCSKLALKKYLASKRSWCLKEDYINNLTTR